MYSSRDSIIQPARSALPCPILHVAPIANLMHFCCLTYRTNARRIAPHHTPPQSTPPHPHCILWTAPQQDKFPLFPVSLITLITPHSPSALPSRLAAPRHTSPHLAAPHCTPLHPTAPHCASLRLTAPHCTSLHLTRDCFSLHLTSPHFTSLHLTTPHCTSLRLTVTHLAGNFCMVWFS